MIDTPNTAFFIVLMFFCSMALAAYGIYRLLGGGPSRHYAYAVDSGSPIPFTLSTFRWSFPAYSSAGGMGTLGGTQISSGPSAAQPIAQPRPVPTALSSGPSALGPRLPALNQPKTSMPTSTYLTSGQRERLGQFVRRGKGLIFKPARPWVFAQTQPAQTLLVPPTTRGVFSLRGPNKTVKITVSVSDKEREQYRPTTPPHPKPQIMPGPSSLNHRRFS